MEWTTWDGVSSPFLDESRGGCIVERRTTTMGRSFDSKTYLVLPDFKTP